MVTMILATNCGCTQNREVARLNKALDAFTSSRAFTCTNDDHHGDDGAYYTTRSLTGPRGGPPEQDAGRFTSSRAGQRGVLLKFLIFFLC